MGFLMCVNTVGLSCNRMRDAASDRRGRWRGRVTLTFGKTGDFGFALLDSRECDTPGQAIRDIKRLARALGVKFFPKPRYT
jgi:hypothetical protein